MTTESPETLTDKEISDYEDRLANAEDVIKNFKEVIAIHDEKEVEAFEDALKQKKFCEETLAYDKLLRDRVQLVEKGEAKKEDVPTKNEFERSVAGAFKTDNTPKEATNTLAQDPKVEGAFNSSTIDSSKKGLGNIGKKTGTNPAPAVEKAISQTGSSIAGTNDNNVGQNLSAVVQNTGYISKMKEYAGNFGSHIISNLPAYLILGVVIATMVFVVEGKVSPAAAAQAAAKQLSGCYMIYGDGTEYNYIKLDGCSDWYSENTNNLLKCRCNNSDNDISKPNDCTGDNSDSPYCINDDSSSGKKKCINPKDKNTPPSALLKCQGEVGEKGTFVRYTSNEDDAIGILTKLLSLVQATGGDTYSTENKTTNTMGLVGKILLGVIIIVTLLILGLIIYNTFFQNRNMIKSMSRR